jgi:hypothetical protein
VRNKILGIVVVAATVALAVFAAAGFGGESAEVRTVEPDYPTNPRPIHRVAQPSGTASASALGTASKKRGKVRLLFFETEAITVPGNATDGAQLECPKGKMVTGYFAPGNTETFLGVSAPASPTQWLIGVKNTSVSPTSSVLGLVCATGVK